MLFVVMWVYLFNISGIFMRRGWITLLERDCIKREFKILNFNINCIQYHFLDWHRLECIACSLLAFPTQMLTLSHPHSELWLGWTGCRRVGLRVGGWWRRYFCTVCQSPDPMQLNWYWRNQHFCSFAAKGKEKCKTKLKPN